MLPFRRFPRGQTVALLSDTLDRAELGIVHGDMRPLGLRAKEWNKTPWREKGSFGKGPIRRLEVLEMAM